MSSEKEKLEWFEIQLRIKTIEVMLGNKYREALGVTLSTLYDAQKLASMGRALGVDPKALLGQLEKMRMELGIAQITPAAPVQAAPTPEAKPLKLPRKKK